MTLSVRYNLVRDERPLDNSLLYAKEKSGEWIVIKENYDNYWSLLSRDVLLLRGDEAEANKFFEPFGLTLLTRSERVATLSS